MKRFSLIPTSINFLMLILLFIISSCSKETMENITPIESEPTKKQAIQNLDKKIDIKAISAISTNQDMGKSNSQSIFSISTSVGQGKIWGAYIPAQYMQVGYKYIAIVTPISGDPDLYVYRYAPWKKIRYSINGAYTYDISYVSSEDMLSSNDKGYFFVYGYTAANFTLEIIKEPLYPTAENTDDYPYDNLTSLCHTTNECTADTWGLCRDNCTSWLAWKINQINGYSQTNLSPQTSYYFYNNLTGTGDNRLGNAHRWDERLASIGITVDNIATPGSICNWEATTSNKAGHVAYVHSVTSNGTITISEYNYNPSCEYNTRVIAPNSASYPDHFIHIEKGY